MADQFSAQHFFHPRLERRKRNYWSPAHQRRISWLPLLPGTGFTTTWSFWYSRRNEIKTTGTSSRSTRPFHGWIWFDLFWRANFNWWSGMELFYWKCFFRITSMACHNRRNWRNWRGNQRSHQSKTRQTCRWLAYFQTYGFDERTVYWHSHS